MHNDDGFSSFSWNIYQQKYAQEKTDGQKESWPETATRVVDEVTRYAAVTPEEKAALKNLITQRKFLPGGRYLYAAGRPFHQVQNCFAGDTKIVTDTGIYPLSEIVNQKVNIRNKDGQWEAATIHCFGEQEIVEIRLQNGEIIETTANHRWWQMDGSRITTEEIEEIPLSPFVPVQADPEGIRHGIVYGDGHLVNNRYSKVILCGDKKQELSRFFTDEEREIEVGFGAKIKVRTVRETKAGHVISLQPSKYKTLPVGCHAEYAKGFITGLIATDGCVSETGSVTISCEGYQKAKEIAELAVLGGHVVTSVRVTSRRSPFDGSERELTQISLKPYTVCAIREDQKQRLEARKLRQSFKPTVHVEEIVHTGRFEPVYCAVVPGSESFTLACGFITSNCLLLRAEDSREGWSDLMQKATMALMTGAGIGVDYSAVRPAGSTISRTGGKSTGPLALMQMVNEAGRHIMQGGARRSAIWAGLNWKHADVSDFIKIKDWSPEIKALKAKDFNFPAPLDMTNISVILDKSFFDAYEDVYDPLHFHAHKIYDLVCRGMVSTAEPGFSVDYDNPKESLRNAPVHGVTRVLTPNGYVCVFDIVDKPITVWTGKRWAQTVFKMTNPDSKLVKVAISSNLHIVCSPEHPFLLSSGERIAAEKLRLNDELMSVDPYEKLHVSGLANLNYTAPVYCCDVGYEEHSFAAEGVIISNCTEITSEDDSDICNLGSLNLARFNSLEDFRDATKLATKFLLAGSVYSDIPYNKVGEVREKNRRLGLGLMGLHEWLLKRGKKYGPDEELGQWLEVYRDVSERTARQTAAEWMISIPVKVRAIAPTGTIGIIGETTTGLEPIFCVAYQRRYKGHDGQTNQYEYVIDPTAKRLIDAGTDPAIVEDAYTIEPERRIGFQAWVQQYVDHGISSTINLPEWGSLANNESTLDKFKEMLYKHLPKVRGITCYPDGCRAGQPLTRVSYEVANAMKDQVFVEGADICDITGKGGSCGS